MELTDLLNTLAEDSRNARDARATESRSVEGRVAVIGSGPAGLAAAVELNSAGCAVQVLEAAPSCGITLLRRPAQESSSEAPASFAPVSEEERAALAARLSASGIAIRTSAPQGMAELESLLQRFDAVLCACGKAAVLPADEHGRVRDNLFAAGTCVKNRKVQDAFQAADSGRLAARSVCAFLEGRNCAS